MQFECPPLDENSIAVKVKACGLSLHDNKVRTRYDYLIYVARPSALGPPGGGGGGAGLGTPLYKLYRYV